MTTPLRFASWNVDLKDEYFRGKVSQQAHLPKIGRLLQQVDVLALQELGNWDVPLKKEPLRANVQNRCVPVCGHRAGYFGLGLVDRPRVRRGPGPQPAAQSVQTRSLWFSGGIPAPLPFNAEIGTWHYPMLRNSASGPEIGLPGRISAGS